jgi:hypothetical protein
MDINSIFIPVVAVVVVAGVAVVAVGRLGAELDPEGDLV